jgi:hypothetical protein
MAKAKQVQDNLQPQVSTDTKVKPTVQHAQGTYMFQKKNYQIMIGGLLLIALGFILMAGGKSPDPHVFNEAEVYSARRIIVAPILVMAGFITEIFAIMWVPSDAQS